MNCKRKKVLFLDQPINNRGDEAAHKSFIRKLIEIYPEVEVQCLFRGVSVNSIEQIRVNSENVEYVLLKNSRGYRKIRELLIKFRLLSMAGLFSFNRELDNFIKNSDVVVVAPGGMNLGGFKTWNHLYIMMRLSYFKKHIIYYSRSIGPFEDKSRTEKLFKNESVKFLKSVDFFSIRDKKSCEIANSLQIPFYPSIDTAFLDIPDTSLTKDVEPILKKKYLVFVPNELIWHPKFQSLAPQVLEKMYLKIIDVLCSIFDYSIIMLPQLYNVKNRDYLYFKKIKCNSRFSDRIIVLDDNKSSDMQQKIISHSSLVVGARYHSIVFAINNNVPFVSLSYEHKMVGLLEQLGMLSCSINLESINDIYGFDYDHFSHTCKTVVNSDANNIREIANRIANKTFIDALTKVI